MATTTSTIETGDWVKLVPSKFDVTRMRGKERVMGLVPTLGARPRLGDLLDNHLAVEFGRTLFGRVVSTTATSVRVRFRTEYPGEVYTIHRSHVTKD